MHPSTPQSLVLGKRTTLAYIIAGDYETLMYFHNGTGIPQPRHSWTNPQLYEHTLVTVSLRNAGNYTLAIGEQWKMIFLRPISPVDAIISLCLARSHNCQDIL